MATTTTPPPTSTDNAKILHNLSLAAFIICPALILLPPRKLDIYTISLLTGTFIGSNQLVQDYTGRSITVRVQESFEQRRLETLRKQQQRKDAPAEVLEWERESLVGKMNMGTGEKSEVLEEVKRRGKWKEERDRREKEAAEEGRGYGDLIADQVWEVWNWGKGGKDEDEKEESEKDDTWKGEGKR